VEAAGLKFVADESEPEHPAPEGVFLIIRLGLPCRGLLLRESLMGDSQAELDVCLDFPGVKRPVEKPELDGSLGEGGVQVQPVVAGAVVMMIPSVRRFLIPEVGDAVQGDRLFPVEILQESGVRLPAVPAFPRGVDLESAVNHVFLARHDVHQVPQGLCRELFGPDMDVDAAGLVGKSSGLAKRPHQFLQLRDVFVGKDGTDHFRAVEAGSICNVSVHLLLGNQAGVVHGFPFPSLFIPCSVGIVGSAFVPAFRPEEAGHEAGGPASRNPCHFHFDSKVQCFHNHLCPFYVCVCSFGTLYITLKAHNSKLF